VHPDCVYASNPYHECVESCLLKIAQKKKDPKSKKKNPGSYILVVPRRLSGKKKGSDSDAELKPSKELNEDFLKSFDFSDTQLNSQQFSFKKVETWDAELMFPKKLTEKKNVQDASTNMEDQGPQDEPKRDMPKKSTGNLNESETTYGNDKVRLSSDLGSLLLQDKSEDGPKDPESKNSCSRVMDHSFEASEDEDPQLVMPDSSCPIGKYKVKGDLSSILQSILDKYGDIAASCKLESIAMRSYYLECICSVIQELQSASVTQLKKAKLKELLLIVKDVEASGINVDWLRSALNKIAEAVDLVKKQRSIEKAKIKCEHEKESVEKELETQLQDVAEKERELGVAKARVKETQARMAGLEEKSSLFDETMASMRSKVGQIDCKTLVNQIL
jgi:hypothetical protein